MLDASIFLDLHRLPELFWGFDRRGGEGPTLYPVACAPQSWAAAAVFLLLEACLGLQIQILNLGVGDASVDIVLGRAGQSVGVTVLAKQADVDIISIK
jgi:glycogen debranching enzyme